MDAKIVSAQGLKSKWKIPPQDVVIVGNEPFVKIRAESFTLMGMVFESNEDAPQVGSAIARKKYSLCCSIGFNMLTKLRNAAQDEAESPAQGGSTLFQDEGIEDSDQDTPGAVSAVADSGKPGEEEDAPAGEKNEEEEAEKPAEDEGGHDDEKPAEEKAVKTAGTVTKRQGSLHGCVLG